MRPQSERYTFSGEASATRSLNARTAEVEARFFLPYLQPGMKLLDCGSGPGSITLGLARAVAPGEVVGIDVQPGQVDIARDAAAQNGVDNVGFQAASIHDLPFEDEQFDVVFAHAVFEHIAEPQQALLELRRVLKSGGILGIRSPDVGTVIFAPDIPLLTDMVDMYISVARSNGGNPLVGRELRGLANGAGFQVQSVTASCDGWGSSESVRSWGEFLRAGIVGPESVVARRAVELGLATQPELDAMVAASLEWESHPDAVFLRTWVEVVATRP